MRRSGASVVPRAWEVETKMQPMDRVRYEGKCACKILHNLPSTAKNLGKWVEHFIQNMEEVSEYL